MQTRNTIYQTHEFHESWNEVVEASTCLETPSEATSDQRQNLFRLQKAISYVDELKNLSDKDLIPVSVWNSFVEPSAKILSCIGQDDIAMNEANVDTANSEIDTLIQSLAPYVLAGANGAKALGHALSAQAKAIGNHTRALEADTVKVLDRGKLAEQTISELLNKTKDLQERLKNFETQLLSEEPDTASVKNKTDKFLEEITSAHERITNYKVELFGNDEELAGSVASKVRAAKTQILSDAEKATKELADMLGQLKDLKDTHKEVMGAPNEEGKVQGGLKAEYESFTKSLREYHEEQTTKHTELFKQIEDLLPGATSAGLGTAFETQREKYKGPIKTFSGIFYFAIGALFIFTGLTFVEFSNGWWPSLRVPGTLSEMFASSVTRIFIVLPFVWLAYFAAKRRNENRRLEEEYAHKETIARAYFGFRQQIEALGQENTDTLSAQLLEAAIMAVSLNASASPDKNHDDKFPNMDQLSSADKLVRTLKSISQSDG